MAEEEGHRVAAAIRVMAGIEAKRHPSRVGLLEKDLDLVFVFDVGFGMGVIDQLQAEPVSGQVGHPVRGFDQSFPGVAIQSTGPGGLSGEEVGIRVVDQDEKAAAQGGHQLAASQRLLFPARARRPDLRGGPWRRPPSP